MSTRIRPPRKATVQVHHEVRVQGVLDQRWSAWFHRLRLTSEPGGVTVVAGPVADQAALHGLLAKVRDLGLPLLLVHRTDAPAAEAGGNDASTR